LWHGSASTTRQPHGRVIYWEGSQGAIAFVLTTHQTPKAWPIQCWNASRRSVNSAGGLSATSAFSAFCLFFCGYSPETISPAPPSVHSPHRSRSIHRSDHLEDRTGPGPGCRNPWFHPNAKTQTKVGAQRFQLSFLLFRGA
jgi:hypothetical protein